MTNTESEEAGEFKLDRLLDEDAGTLTEVRDALHEGPFVRPMLTYEDHAADNTYRAAWVAEALATYAGITGTLEQETPETIIRDFLSDLRHLIDALPLDENGDPPSTLEEMVDGSEVHYAAEIEGGD